MKCLFPPEGQPIDPSWWAPLDAVRRAVVATPRYRFFDIDDFMLMGGIDRRPRPRVLLYKHYYTRRYLNLDDAGHAYRYIAPRSLESKSPGRYVGHPDLRLALDHLLLWELPWMKAGLEPFCQGLSWEERWLLHPDEVDSFRAVEPGRRETPSCGP
jgi:hypothetical protein